MSDSTRRALRGILDLIPAVLAALLVLVPVLNLPAETVAKVGAVIGAVTVALAKIRNALEDAGVIPAVLKAPASDGANPVPDGELVFDEPVRGPAPGVYSDDQGAGELRLALAIAGGLLIAFIVWALIGDDIRS